MRNAYISTLYELAGQNKDILALISDNGAIVYDKYRSKFPEQFINFGISEANMVSVAAGMASCGKIPFAYTIAGFLTMRAYEQVRNDVCLQKQNVKLIGVGAGYAYSTLGPTHHATEDISIMRVLPYMTIISPGSPMEVRKATIAAAQMDGPVYIRLENNKEPEIYNKDYQFEIGKGVALTEGCDVCIFSYGSILYEIMKAAEELKSVGIGVKVVNMHTLKPIDSEIILEAAEEIGCIVSIEEHNVTGGLGSTIAEVLAENSHAPVIFERIGLKETFCKGYGSRQYLRELNGISKEVMKNKIIDLMKRKQLGRG